MRDEKLDLFLAADQWADIVLFPVYDFHTQHVRKFS